MESDEKIFDLSQKLYKMREKANDFLEHIDFYKNKISEIDSEILNLTNELTKRQKEEKEQEAQKSKELKVKVEEHNKCERNIDNLNKLIEMNRRELEMKTTQIAKQERKKSMKFG